MHRWCEVQSLWRAVELLGCSGVSVSCWCCGGRAFGPVMESLLMDCGWICALRSPTTMVGTESVEVVVGVGCVSVGMVVVRSCESVCHAAFLSSCGLSLRGM